ncbi:RagB/SusD family nutrient uptake outer membrane protein [Flavihumibacter rivuli]|uniref:RagB/SusD family nutrient uptake outer membrane protein n=1 Tax=Flavihumibacter rivuli TaxID=2838156 RepID=UPI001BDEDBB5|nr:RagB/SusD family nutrient uptake outer membrane protein [Flavihumibacter rivuli]ULQ55226.1 RagB/SusD family nutrient uptake outer membrane protein [Flavihumibacter rivuli]
MSNHFKIICVSLALSTTMACSKFVDYNPQEDYQITAENYFTTVDDYQKMVVGTYSPLQWLWGNTMIGDIASDNSVSGGENATDVLGLQQIDDYQITPINSYLTEAWKACYEGINRANYLHENKAKLDFNGKDALYGEVYFLRAYYYFELVRLFGDVPLFVDRRLSASDSRQLQRTPKAEVYKQIETDLNNAIAVLPPTNNQKGRITRYAAKGLLAKVLLYENKFDEAATVLEDVLSWPFTLVDDYNSIFLESGENGPESVFEIQYSNSAPFYDWSNPGRGQGNFAVQHCGIRNLTGSSPYGQGWSINLPTQQLANAFEAGDQRKAVTILDIEAYKNANPGFNITYQVAPYKNTGLYNHKYQPRKGQTSGQVELNYLNNFRTLRYAEVLLIAAEANNRKASPDDAKARACLNRVRQRAFRDNNHDINLSGAALKEAIWEERRLELAMEGDRFFDLVRTGKAAEKITGFQKGKNEVFPIPQQEVDISGLTQNPGY